MAFISIAVGALAVFGAVQADGGHNRPKPLPAGMTIDSLIPSFMPLFLSVLPLI